MCFLDRHLKFKFISFLLAVSSSVLFSPLIATPSLNVTLSSLKLSISKDHFIKMAALHTAADNSECVSRSQEIFSKAFMPKDTLDQPCDVILVVKDGKEFKAHGQVLSEASPFFGKLLNTDMKESKEGIIRLEMFSESVIRNTLEFVYTSHVPILTEDNVRDLIVTADYLLLQNLKSLTEGFLLQKLDTSNCFST